MMNNTGEALRNSACERLVGVDVGGTKIEAVLTDPQGHVADAIRVPARQGADAVLEDIIGVARQLMKRNDACPVALGIGIPGRVDSVSGVVSNVINLGITELDLGARASRLMAMPAYVENDVNAAASGAAAALEGERTADTAKNPLDGDTTVFLNLGTGLAAGVLRNGRIQHGHSGALGEIGHIPVDPNRFACRCGQRGCLETVASGGSVARLWPTADPAMPDLIACAHQGNPEALRVLGMVIHAIADTIQIVAQSYDPRLIIVGGGMANTGQPLLDEIDGALRRREGSSPFVASMNLHARLRLAPPGQPVGAVGAALAAHARIDET